MPSNLRLADQHQFGKQKNMNKCNAVHKDSWSGIFTRCRKNPIQSTFTNARLSGWSHALGEGFAGFTVAAVSASALRRHSLLLDNRGRAGGKGGHGRPEKETTWIMQLMEKRSLFLFFTSLAGGGGTQVLIKHSSFIQLHWAGKWPHAVTSEYMILRARFGAGALEIFMSNKQTKKTELEFMYFQVCVQLGGRGDY